MASKSITSTHSRTVTAFGSALPRVPPDSTTITAAITRLENDPSDAFAKAREDNFIGTDESSLVERLDQVEVSVVMGSDRNIKITKPSDMDLARLFLAEELAARVSS